MVTVGNLRSLIVRPSPPFELEFSTVREIARILQPSDLAWITLAAGVLTYEVYCPTGQLLSDAADRYRTRRPLLINLVVLTVASHLVRLTPRPIDPIHHMTYAVKKFIGFVSGRRRASAGASQ
jgi:hypothetical protein